MSISALYLKRDDQTFQLGGKKFAELRAAFRAGRGGEAVCGLMANGYTEFIGSRAGSDEVAFSLDDLQASDLGL